MITIKQHNTTALTGLGILRDLESFSLQDINEAIKELETKIGKNYFGDGWSEKLQVLYSLKKFSSKNYLNDEVRDLKEALVNKYTEMYGQSEAWVVVFNMVADLQNQLRIFSRATFKQQRLGYFIIAYSFLVAPTFTPK